MSREALTVRVRNVLGIIKADLTLAGVTLVGGVNAAGKSSLLEAVAACALAEPNIRGLRTKADQARALHEGAEVGSVTVEYERGKVRLLYPAGETEQTGRPVFLGTALGIGRVRFMMLKPEERAREFILRAKAEPTLADLAAWFAAHPGSGLEHPDRAKQVEDLWADIEGNGWDPVCRRIKEYGTKRKGAWEQVTKVKWGDKKAQSWVPVGIDPAEEYSLEDETKRLSALEAEIKAFALAEAAAAIDVKRLQEDAKADTGAASAIERTSTERAALQAQIDNKVQERHAIAVPGEESAQNHLCPHCGQGLALRRNANSALFIEKAPAPPDKKKSGELRARALEIDHDIQTLNASAKRLAEQDVTLRAQIATATKARERLAEAQAAAPLDKERAEVARTEKLATERLIGLLNTRDQATAIFADWKCNNFLIDALDTDGVRQVVLERGLSRINKMLAQVTEVCAMRAVEITADMDVLYDGRPYGLCSESERWRADFALSAHFHRQEDATLLLLDRFDVLVPQDRGPVLMGIKRMKITALIAMTAKDRAGVPDLAAAKVGAAVWVDAGVVGPCK